MFRGGLEERLAPYSSTSLVILAPPKAFPLQPPTPTRD